MGGVKGTKYLLKTRNNAPRKTKNSVPPLFFEKAGDKNNFRILKKQYAYLQIILKAPVKFEKDWPKTVGGVAGRRMVGALTDGHSKFQRV